VNVRWLYTSTLCGMMAASLPDYESFDCADLSNAGPRWTRWMSRFEILMTALNIGDTDAHKLRKNACLLHYMGAECFDIYDTLKSDDDFGAVKDNMMYCCAGLSQLHIFLVL